jgi:DNA-binding transcriptional ArsR family regulator
VPHRLEQQRLEQRLKALGSGTRLEIVRLLATGEAQTIEHPPRADGGEPTSGPDEACLCRLAVALNLAAPTVSRHMAVLRDAGMVTARREGQWVHFSLHREALGDLADQIVALKNLGPAEEPE